MGIDGTTALDAWGNWNPGFDGMDLGDAPYQTMSPRAGWRSPTPTRTSTTSPMATPGVARSLVRALIPAALPGSTMEDLVTTASTTASSTSTGTPVRLRLGSSVVRVEHDGDPATPQSVDRDLRRTRRAARGDGRARGPRLLAPVIPYLTDEIADGAGRRRSTTSTRCRCSTPMCRSATGRRSPSCGIDGFADIGGFWNGAEIDFPVSMGDYQFADTPADPVCSTSPRCR